jgi:hypothetical protein
MVRKHSELIPNAPAITSGSPITGGREKVHQVQLGVARSPRRVRNEAAARSQGYRGDGRWLRRRPDPRTIRYVTGIGLGTEE